MRRSVIALPLHKPKGYKILLEVLAGGSYQRIVAFPYIFKERGKSWLGPRQYLEFLAHAGILATKA